MTNVLAQSRSIDKFYRGFPSCEYLMIANPGLEITASVNEMKNYFEGLTDGDNFIEIGRFAGMDELENLVIRWIRRICAQTSAFQVTLNNYGGLPPSSIYLRVLDDTPFKELRKAFEPLSQFLKANGNQPVQFPRKPHLGISSNVHRDQYFRVMWFFSQRTFNRSFWLREIVLLKRNHPYDDFTLVAVLPLYPPKINNIRGAA